VRVRVSVGEARSHPQPLRQAATISPKKKAEPLYQQRPESEEREREQARERARADGESG